MCISLHSFVLMTSFLGSLGLFIAGLIIKKDDYEAGTAMWVTGLVYFFTHAILIELLLIVKAASCRHRLKTHDCLTSLKGKFPLVYSNKYNISFCGLEKLHPFDAQKYRRTY